MDFGGSGDVNIGVGGDISPLRQALDQIPALARQAGEAASQAFASASSSGSGVAGAFDAATTATKNLADAMTGAVGAAADLDRELQQKPGDAGAASAAFGDLGKQLSDAGAAMVLIGGTLSVISAGLIELGESSLMAAGKMEQQRVAMVNLTHSAEQTDTLIRGLVEFAIKTPFEIPGVIEMGQKLVAMGTATTDVIPLLRTLGDTASGSGKGFAGLNTLVNDFGKMAQLGTVHMRELNTLAYQGVPAIQALADAFGVSTNRMRQMIEQNLVASADAMPILTKAMADKFGGMMEAQAKTLLGMWSNFKDSIVKTLIAIGDALTPAFKAILEAVQPALDMIQKMAEWFAQLPAPVQNTVLALGIVTAAIGPLVLALGGFLFVAGNIITKLPALAALLGIELPAAMVASTTATTGLTAAQGAMTLAAGAGRSAMLALNAAVSAGYDIMILTAGAYAGFKAGEWIREQIPGFKEFFDQIADGIYATAGFKQLIDWIGGVPTVIKAVVRSESEWMDMNIKLEDRMKAAGVAITSVNTTVEAAYKANMELARAAGLMGDAHSKAAGGINLAATGLKKLQDAQSDANQAVKVAKDVMDAAKEALDGSATAAAVYTRAVQVYDEAIKKANPSIASSSKAFDEQALAAQTTGAEMLKYVKLWSTIPWEVWQGDVAGVGAAIKEQGFNIDKAVASLNKMIAAWEGAATTSEVIKAMRDEAIAAVNQLNNMKTAVEDLNKTTTGWHQTLENGVIVWRENNKEATGFTTTMVNGVTVIKGAKESVDGLSGAMKGLAGATKESTEAWVFQNGEWIKGTDLIAQVGKSLGSTAAAAESESKSVEKMATTHKATAKQIQDSTSIMKDSFMQGMSGMTASGEQYIAMLAQLGAPDGMLAQTARAFGYLEVGIRQYINAAEALKRSMSPTQTAMTKFFFGGSMEDFINEMKDISARLHPAADAVTHLGDSATQTAQDIPKVYQPLTDAVGNAVKVFQPLTSSTTDATSGLYSVADAATKVSGNVSSLGQTMNTSGAVIKSVKEMWDTFPDEMRKAQGLSMTNLIDLGVNFYDAQKIVQGFGEAVDEAGNVIRSSTHPVDAMTVAMNNAANQAVDFSQSINLATASTDEILGFIKAAGQGLDDVAHQSIAVQAAFAELAKRNFWHGAPSDGDSASKRASFGIPDDATNIVYSEDGNSVTYSSASQGASALDAAWAQRLAPHGTGMVANPNSMYNGGMTNLGQISPVVGLGSGANGASGVTVNITGNNIMDQRTVDSLANRMMTQATNIMRQNAGLKV